MFAAVKERVAIVALASVTWPCVSVVILISTSLITTAPLKRVVSILKSSPAWAGCV